MSKRKSAQVRVRAKLRKDGACEVKALIKHPMETGLRKDKKTGKVIPAKFVQEVTCQHNGKDILTAQWGGAISTNPFIEFVFEGAQKGDLVTLSWVDNTGAKDSSENYPGKEKAPNGVVK